MQHKNKHKFGSTHYAKTERSANALRLSHVVLDARSAGGWLQMMHMVNVAAEIESESREAIMKGKEPFRAGSVLG